MTAADPTVSDMQRASSMMNLKQHFPELSEKQFIICAAYAMGSSIKIISELNNSTIEATKKQLQRSREALNTPNLQTMRSVFVMRTLWGIYARKIPLV